MYDPIDLDTCVSSTNIQKDYFKKCINVAHRSNLTHKHGCVLVKNGEIISVGYNYKLANDSGTRYQMHANGDIKNMYSIHAEVSTIKKVKKKDLRNCEMYVVRIGPGAQTCGYKNELGLNATCPVSIASAKNKNIQFVVKYSHPCQHCSDMINQFGIRRVYYSVNLV
jgi:deoxycytidylate deaminase